MEYENFIKSKEFKIINKPIEIERDDLNSNLFEYQKDLVYLALKKGKLACTATPAPNDFMELGNHCQFLNVMQRHEMLASFFVHDGGETSKWRLKGHARDKFWEWVSNWAVLFTKPSDIGYSEEEDKKYSLPKKYLHDHIVKSPATNGLLFNINAETLNERRAARRETLQERCQLVADIVNNSDDIWIVWCDLNAENDLLKKLINDSVAVKGADKDNHKIQSAEDFKKNKIKALITKPSMFGFGQNWQNCHNMIFTGLSDSFEQVFQAERRCYRFGQKHDVNVHIVISEAEGNVKKNQQRKEKQFLTMIDELVVFSKAFTLKEIKNLESEKNEYNPQMTMIKPKFIQSED